jgi:hypothetical protein
MYKQLMRREHKLKGFKRKVLMVEFGLTGEVNVKQIIIREPM